MLASRTIFPGQHCAAAADIEYLKSHAAQIGTNVLLRRLADHAPINYARAFFRG
jgi:hypothetical protein